MVTIDGSGLTLEEVVRVARQNEAIEIAHDAIERMERSRAVVERLADGDAAVYGVNTGFGLLANTRIPARVMISTRPKPIPLNSVLYGLLLMRTS